MDFDETALPGVYLVRSRVLADSRGVFCKTYQGDAFRERGIGSEFVEAFYSVSEKNVIRGMHFQVPPAEHEKLVSCSQGSIFDVVLDLRVASECYGRFIGFEISANEGCSIFVPKGCAHGFLSLTSHTIVSYLVSSVHSPSCDQGVRFDSFGVDWGVTNPIVSSRDSAFPPLEDFRSPF